MFGGNVELVVAPRAIVEKPTVGIKAKVKVGKGGKDGFEFGGFLAQLGFGKFAIANVATGVEGRPATDGNSLHVNQQGVDSPEFIGNVPFEIGNFAVGVEAIEGQVAEQAIDLLHLRHFRNIVAEDDMNVGTDVGETSVAIDNENGIGNRTQNQLVQGLRVLQLRPCGLSVGIEGAVAGVVE